MWNICDLGLGKVFREKRKSIKEHIDQTNFMKIKAAFKKILLREWKDKSNYEQTYNW